MTKATQQERVNLAKRIRQPIEVQDGDVLTPYVAAGPARKVPAHCKHIGWGHIYSVADHPESYMFISNDRHIAADLRKGDHGWLMLEYAAVFNEQFSLSGLMT